MNLNQYILCTLIARKILEIVLEEHPEIVTKATQRTIESLKETKKNAQVQEEDNTNYQGNC